MCPFSDQEYPFHVSEMWFQAKKNSVKKAKDHQHICSGENVEDHANAYLWKSVEMLICANAHLWKFSSVEMLICENLWKCWFVEMLITWNAHLWKCALSLRILDRFLGNYGAAQAKQQNGQTGKKMDLAWLIFLVLIDHDLALSKHEYVRSCLGKHCFD